MKKFVYPVFEFTYDVDGGGGTLLIASRDSEDAINEVNRLPVGFGKWEYQCEVKSLKSDRLGIISQFKYAN